MAVKFRGSVEDVKAAVDAAAVAAEGVSGVITKHIIANTEESTDKMLRLNAFDKK
jgi:microcompartment protein CcmL/EutN